MDICFIDVHSITHDTSQHQPTSRPQALTHLSSEGREKEQYLVLEGGGGGLGLGPCKESAVSSTPSSEVASSFNF